MILSNGVCGEVFACDDIVCTAYLKEVITSINFITRTSKCLISLGRTHELCFCREYFSSPK